MTEEEINKLIEDIVNILKKKFYETGELCFGDIDEQDSMSRVYWNKDLSIMRYCEYIYEDDIFEGVIDCNNALSKATTIDEAWEAATPFVYDYLDNWIIGAEYYDQFGSDVDKYIKEFHLLRELTACIL